MIKKNFEKLKKYFFFKKNFVLIPLIICLFFIGISYTQFVEHLRVNFEWTPAYLLKRKITPLPVHPQLKIIAFDDQSLAYKNGNELSVQDWIDLLKEIAKYKPKAIFIDRLFSFVGEEKHLVENFIKVGENIPICVGATILEAQIPRPVFSEEFWGEFSPEEMPHSHKIPSVKGIVYGPALEILPAFHSVGHLLFFDWHKIQPFFMNTSRTKALIQGVLPIADKIELKKNGVKINNALARFDENGFLHIVPLFFKDFYPYMTSVAYILHNIKNNNKVNFINEGDYVVILPAIYTGNADIKPSPVGPESGGMHMASIANTILLGNWSIPIGYTPLFILIMITLATILSSLSHIQWAIAANVILNVSFIVISLLLYVFFLVEIPWFIPSVGAIVTSSTLLIQRARILQNETRIIRSALDGLVPESLLKSFYNNPRILLDQKPKQKEVSIMFIDIVGFSLISELYPSETTFTLLRQELELIKKIIIKYGGIIDKTLGDGLLCFFGHSYDGTCLIPHHADAALQCAIAVQHENIRNMIHRAQNNQPIFELRIGINTGAAHLGNLGTQQRMDFTIIGPSVNFAKRLEDACEPSRIMISQATKESLRYTHNITLKPREMSIKHHTELITAWEYDPHEKHKEIVKTIKMMAAKQIGREKRQERIKISKEKYILCKINNEDAFIIDFSLDGIGFLTKKYFALKVVIELEINVPNLNLQKKLEENAIQKISVEIKHGQTDENGYYKHGAEIKNLSLQQKETLFAILKEACQ